MTVGSDRKVSAVIDGEPALLLGRVMFSKGGDLILKEAKRVLAEEHPECTGKRFPALSAEKSRRVGQSVAAASL